MTGKRIAVTGASGLVGQRLIPYLEASGAEVIRLVRSRPVAPQEIYWNPSTGEIDHAALDGVDAVVHLAGVSIAGKRWNESRKREIYDSRIQSTQLLARTIAELPHPPTSFISTSAVGYYGDSGSQVLSEASPNGTGFLADVCEAWESAADPTRDVGIRVVHPRFGVVLAPEGGMLPQIARLFRLGLGGRIGNGEQYMSWIDIDDLTRILHHLVEYQGTGEMINAVAPNPVTNREYTKALGMTLGRPTVLPAPAFAIRLALGQMGEELVLASQRAEPTALLDADFKFLYPTIQESLRHTFEPTGSSAGRKLPLDADGPAVPAAN